MVEYESIISMGSGFVAGNFIYQAFSDKNWGVAFERSWFIGAYAIALLVAG